MGIPNWSSCKKSELLNNMPFCTHMLTLGVCPTDCRHWESRVLRTCATCKYFYIDGKSRINCTEKYSVPAGVIGICERWEQG